MRIGPKFIDIGVGDTQLNLGKLEYASGESPVTTGEQTITGKKTFEMPPKIAAALDPTAVPAEKIATAGYVTQLVADLVGTGKYLSHTITADDIAAKGISLSDPVSAGMLGSVVVVPVDGPELARGIDFEVLSDGSGITWNGYSIDETIESGDVLTLVYKTSAEKVTL
mgnify:FL=1